MNTDIDTTVTTTVRAAKLHRLGTRRMTRAHLALQKRPALVHALNATAQAVSAALKAQLGADMDISGRILDAVFRPDLHLSADAAIVVMDLDGCGSTAVLELERSVLGAALDRLSGNATKSAPSGRLTRIEETAFGFIALVALQAIRGNASIEKLFAPRLRAVNPTRGDALEIIDGRAHHVGAQLSIKIGTVVGQARLFMPAKALQNAVQAEPTESPAQILPEVLAAAITVRTHMGRSVLDATDLESLRVGDCVLFDDVRLEDGRVSGEGRLSSSGFELLGAFGAAGFTFTRALARSFPQESSMSQPNPKSDAPALPVDVEIELTRLRLTVSELANIRPGGVLPLHINATEPVILRVGDRAIARAELVEIDGEVGARILALLS